MKNINFTLGAISGLIAGTVGVIFSHTVYLLGITPFSSIHLAAAILIRDNFKLSLGGFILALINHLVISATFGVAMVIILYYTGEKHYIIKGLGFGYLTCLFLSAFLIPIIRTDIDLIPSAVSSAGKLFTHSLIGLISAFIIVKYRKLNTNYQEG